MAFNIEYVPNQSGKPAVLLRQAWREGHRIRKKTIANLSKLPADIIDGFHTILKGGVAVEDLSELVDIRRSLAHGHVLAVLGTARRLHLDRLLHRQRSRARQLALAAIISRVLMPDSKLATARRLSPRTATSSLGHLLDLGEVSGNEMLAMLDWLRDRQPWIERSLARRHLHDATLVLYDVSSTYLEGEHCPLARFGYNRDGKTGKKQVVFGLLCSAEGCPLAVELFAGNTADPQTVANQVDKVRTRFGIRQLAMVGDRGLLTTARIHADLQPAGLDWISALRTVDLRRLAATTESAAAAFPPPALQPDAVAEITSVEFPGERLMVCYNPRLRQQRRHQREQLLQATETALARIATAVHTGRLSGVADIGRRLGREVNRWKVEKHFDITIEPTALHWTRRHQDIDDEARFDGLYVIRTSLPANALDAHATVAAYKSLATVERAFRTTKSELRLRPIFVYTENHVRGHVFLCMLAYYLEWHLRRRLAPLLFEDDDRPAAAHARTTPVAPAERSPTTRRKLATRRTAEGFPLHSFRTLLDDLSSVALNTVTLPGTCPAELTIMTEPTPLQQRAFELLDVRPA